MRQFAILAICHFTSDILIATITAILCLGMKSLIRILSDREEVSFLTIGEILADEVFVCHCHGSAVPQPGLKSEKTI
jgi:hypothetical protein